MEAYARAGIDIYGSVLRYAEVEQYGSHYRLLRLGSCDFDFDVTHEVLHGDQPSHLATVAEALSDVFSGSVASSFQVTLHPPGCYSFFTPLPAGSSDAARKVRLQQEASLLAGVDEPLRLTADAIYSSHTDDGDRIDWVHVLAVPEQTHARFDRIAHGLPEARHRLMLSMQAAATTTGRILRRQSDEQASPAPYSLVIGWYPSHVEFTLCRQHRWYYSHFAEAGQPVDAAYYAVALLKRLRLPPADVGHLFVYGQDVDLDAFAPLQAAFAARPERLDPLLVVDLDPGSLTTEFDASAYVPCMGAAL